MVFRTMCLWWIKYESSGQDLHEEWRLKITSVHWIKKKKEARLFSCQSKQKHSRVVLREHFDQKNERSPAKIGLVFRDRSDKTSVHQEDGKTYRHRFSIWWRLVNHCLLPWYKVWCQVMSRSHSGVGGKGKQKCWNGEREREKKKQKRERKAVYDKWYASQYLGFLTNCQQSKLKLYCLQKKDNHIIISRKT